MCGPSTSQSSRRQRFISNGVISPFTTAAVAAGGSLVQNSIGDSSLSYHADRKHEEAFLWVNPISWRPSFFKARNQRGLHKEDGM